MAAHVVNAIPHANIESFPSCAMMTAHILDHADLFASVTNTISKYLPLECTEVFRDLEANDPLFGLYGESICTLLTCSFDHIPGQKVGDSLRRIQTDPLCPDYANAISKCHMAMVRAGIWQPMVQPLHLAGPNNGVNNIVPLGQLPQTHCGSLLCMPTVTSTFDNELATLRRQLEEKFVGVCLDCFKAGGLFDGQCRIEHDK